jgi:hypothetical protein
MIIKIIIKASTELAIQETEMNEHEKEKARHTREMAGISDDPPINVVDVAHDEKVFGLRMIDTPEGRNKASVLVNKMYSWRGYAGTHVVPDDPNRITLTATHQGETVGTLTLGIDSPIGILADEIFKDEIDVYRGRGAKVCEITKLAFEPGLRSKETMASLFHLSVLYARDLHGCSDLFIEVNPRHRRFYEHMLGFKHLGAPKTNPRVNAPAYLLWVGFDYVTTQIDAFGGRGDGAGGERSFYPLFFSSREEKGIVKRLREMH